MVTKSTKAMNTRIKSLSTPKTAAVYNEVRSVTSKALQSLPETDRIITRTWFRAATFIETKRMVLYFRKPNEPTNSSSSKLDAVFLQHAEAKTGPWWEARINQLISLNQTEEAGALYREFETPENGI